MTALNSTSTSTSLVGRAHVEDALVGAEDPVEVAREHVLTGAFRAGPEGERDRRRVGLELEMHLVELARPSRRPTWPEVAALVDRLPAMPAGSTVTVEPGGQVELSTPPGEDVVVAVDLLRRDRAALKHSLVEQGYGGAPLGTDPAREVRRINPHPRYAAMEAHFDALGCAGSGMAMMSGTAALQVNLDAGPEQGWEDRFALVRAMVPMLVAASATSPYLAGTSTGWASMRQGTWQGIDHGRSDPVPDGEPGPAWAFYALSAPVMLVRDGDRVRPVTERVPFVSWLRGTAPADPFDRPATLADLDYHLTTLFPPVRPRGYVEIRCLDALPDRWWPAVAALVATLIDVPAAADRARQLCEPVADRWEDAARLGLEDAAVRRAVTGCVQVAMDHAPVGLEADLADYAEVVERGGPTAELRERIARGGPLSVLEEEARG